MRSVPAPHLLVIPAERPKPGELARDYIGRFANGERAARHRQAEHDQWVAQKTRNRTLGKGRAAQALTRDDLDPLTGAPRLEFVVPPQMLYDMPERDKQRIRAAAARIEARRPPPVALPSRLGREDRSALLAASGALTLGGVASDHEVDEIFAGLHAAFPWLGRATEALWRQARLGAARGEPFHVGPMLLLGSPGLGKSTFARRLGAAFGVPTIPVDVGATGGVFDLQGTDSKWGGSSPGRVMRSLLATRVGNAVVVVDEVDASGPVSSTGGRGFPGIGRVLMGMIEPATAAAWVCPYHEVPVDLRHLSWILTANSVAQVEQALLDRAHVVELPPLSREHLLLAARAMAAERLDEEAAALLVEEVARALRRGARLGLRRLARIVEAMEAAAARPVLQ